MKNIFKIILMTLLIFTKTFSIDINKNYEKEFMYEVNKWVPNKFEDLKKLDEDSLYKIAKEKYHYQDSDKNLYSKSQLLEIEKLVDKQKLNKYFMILLNNERRKKGLKKVSYSGDLFKAVKIRANEISSEKKLSHTRPSKEGFWTAIDRITNNFKYKKTFENILMVSMDNEAQMISEKFLAEKFFEIWKNSKKHYIAMMDKDIGLIALDFSLGFSNKNNFNMQINYAALFGAEK